MNQVLNTTALSRCHLAVLFLSLALVAGPAKAHAPYAVMIRCTDGRPVVFARCEQLADCDVLQTVYAGDGEADRFCGPDNWRMWVPANPTP